MPRLSCCLYLALMIPLPVRAQDLASFTGFTRPGAPNDTREDGKVRYAADDPNLKKTAIGATVYFTVLDLTAKAD